MRAGEARVLYPESRIPLQVKPESSIPNPFTCPSPLSRIPNPLHLPESRVTACVREGAGTLDSFVRAVEGSEESMSKVPVVTDEIGDTWLYGVASDPIKLSLLREATRCIRRAIAAKRLSPNNPFLLRCVHERLASEDGQAPACTLVLRVGVAVMLRGQTRMRGHV
jgi:hypothetical protein